LKIPKGIRSSKTKKERQYYGKKKKEKKYLQNKTKKKEEKFGDTKETIGNRKSNKGRQYNGQKKKGYTNVFSFHYTAYMA
jgi:hypothetical protein